MMEKLLAALAEKNIKLTNCTDEQVIKVAKSVGLDPVDFTKRKVEIVQHTNKRENTNTFIKTSAYIVGRKPNGRADTVRGLFARVEAIDDIIKDLLEARAMLDATINKD